MRRRIKRNFWSIYLATLIFSTREYWMELDYFLNIFFQCWEFTLKVRGKMHFGQVLFRHNPEFVRISSLVFLMQFILQNGNRYNNAYISLMLTVPFEMCWRWWSSSVSIVIVLPTGRLSGNVLSIPGTRKEIFLYSRVSAPGVGAGVSYPIIKDIKTWSWQHTFIYCLR